MEKSREEFFQAARELGIEQKEAISILRRNHIDGKYDPGQYTKYIGILAAHSKIMKKLLDIANGIRDNDMSIDKCPICGWKVERDISRDYLYGGGYGWKCLNPEQGLASHFFQHRLERIRPWMQRNQDMSLTEMSLEMESKIESQSGENQVVVSS